MRIEKTKEPLVSVVMPAYNAEQHICAALDSVLAQTYHNLQVIVVDDASTDKTATLLASYDDSRLEVIRQPENRHICAARNRGLERVKGEYVAFLDSDDVWHPDKIEKQVAFLEREHQYGACFTWCKIIDADGNIREQDDEDVSWLYNAFRANNRSHVDWLMRLLTGGNLFVCSSAMIRAEVISCIGFQNLSLLQLQDFDYAIRILSICNVYIICEELVEYRRVKNGESLSSVSELSKIRTINEDIFVCTHFFDYISDDLFIALFHDSFKRKDSVTSAELACEKAFFLQKAYCAPEPFLIAIQRLLSDAETSEVLQKKFGFTPKDFYKINAERRYFDRGYKYQQQERESQVQQEMRNKDGHIDQLLQTERLLTAQLADRVNELRTLRENLLEQRNLLDYLSKNEQKLMAEIDEKNVELSAMGQRCCNQQGHIELLLESDRELQRIKASRSWRFMGYVWRLRDWLLPKGSRRRLLCKMLIRFVKHPIQFLSKCTPKKVAKFFKTLHQEGVEGTSRKLDDCLLYPQGVVSSLKISPVDIQVQKAKDDYAPLQVPKWEKPEVSIIIPVYNQFEYTYACVESIIRNSGEVSYEILIADDCSTDLTEQIDDIIGGLHTIHNEKNLRFLLNCNHAAKQARGEYILFLNNDTQVQENWLEPLVSLMQKDPSIGMTGSKLVYPDGRLQEAGGILWSDGSAWNYGNRSDPNAPEYNYVKEVDYISGASICIRRELWEEIGGFDERFVPAYCEDSDLAFEVRRHGYKVVYQPLSVVVHFEGVSNGTDVASGQKAYQVVNQKKFFEKWQQILTQDHYPNGEKVFLARERGRNAKVLLMVDHYVPQYDKDAGSRTVFQYLKLFAESGYHVKFIGDNFFPHQPYTQVLQQMGVEVLYGNWYAKNWKEWLRENGGCIEYAFLNRPHISVKYIDEVRKYTKAFIAYYGHDLHFLREYREYELTGDKGHLQDSVEWKEKELALMRKADIAYYPSVVEEQEIHRIAPEVNVKAIPAYLFADVPDADYSASSRQDVMFIGGFGHRPNVDAVVWLAKEIMPRLNTSLPGLVVHILGSNPPKEVTDLQTENLRIEGFVTDERLEQYYRECRMAIVPLRYGAGIKGKVVEAMRYGMPVLTTSVGAEGMIGAEGILAVEDTPEDFAARFVSLYEDHAALERVSRQEVAYIRENYSPANAIRVIGKEFDMEDLRS